MFNIMLNKLISQKKDGWCGPTALSYALKEQGLNVSQNKLARLSNTTIKDGVDPKQLQTTGNKLGVNVTILKGKSLNQLDTLKKQGNSIIIDYLSGNNLRKDGHYALYIKKTDDSISLLDPSTAKRKSLGIDYFNKHWKDITKEGKVFNKLALLVKK